MPEPTGKTPDSTYDSLKNMKVLYVGPLFSGSTALHRLHALGELGCRLTAINTELPFGFRLPRNNPKWYLKRFLKKTDYLVDWRRIHSRISAESSKGSWDLLWIDKGTRIRPGLLSQFRAANPSCKLVNYSPDDMFNPANQTSRYLQALAHYDLHVTTKSYNIEELRSAGARDAFFVGNAFEPSIHRPLRLSGLEQAAWGCDVSFVGDCEPERQTSVEFLAAAHPEIKIGLFGPWSHVAAKFTNVHCHEGFFADDAYAKAISAGKIGLGFLRKANRDLQTTRSVELPACGVFMLAERTEEHLALFEEGLEAEFFATNSELTAKVKRYLSDDAMRKRIATAGYEKCQHAGYSNRERLKSVLDYLECSGSVFPS